MRTLDELGISPAPWEADEWEGAIDVRIRDANDDEIAQPFESYADARLIAAAPMLYEALREMCEWLSDGIKERGSINPHWAKAMDALAAASGESEEG